MGKNLTITMKIATLVGVLVLFTALAGVGYQILVGQVRDLGVEKTTDIMMQGYERELQELVDTQAITMAAAIEGLEDADAQKGRIIALQKDVRFDPNKTGYFFVYEPDGTVITVPPKPALTGKNLITLKDKKDRPFIQDLLSAAQKGGGFVEYYWDKGNNNIQPKLSYARQIPGTQFMIGTGVYIDDVVAEKTKVLATIHEETTSFLWKLWGVLAVAFAGVLALTWLLIRSIILPVREIQHAVTQVSTGKLDVQINGEYGGEMGKLKSAVTEMVEKLKNRAQVAQAIAAGDISMTVPVDSNDDVLGQAMRTMSDRLNDLLGQIQIAGEQITSGANQVADSSQTLSHGATQQASAIEEISASTHELASQTKQNAENAGVAKGLGEEMSSAAGRGTEQMSQMVTAMHEINEAGQNISNIIKTIDEIAFQTNLLALNAAVEAARAGQHGKGFAVVAEEVRNLAARSAKAASETAELIEGSVKKGEAGVEIADRTAEALSDIVTNITKTNDIVSEIAASSNEQAEGIAQMNQGLQQIDSVTQQNTATAEESAASAEELSSQTAHLQSMIQQFKLRASAVGMRPPAPVKAHVAPKPAAKPMLTSVSPQAPKPAAAASGGGWDDMAASQQIALDDNEFGKY